MNADTDPSAPLYDAETESVYSLEIVARLAGVSTDTVLRYHEMGVITATNAGPPNGAEFDTECLRQLRRIEHLRESCELSERGLKLVLDLMEEVEQLRDERRRMGR